MRERIFLLGIAALLMGGMNTSYAKEDSYYPPERIHCKLNHLLQLSCKGFNRSFLIEDTSNAEFVGDLNQTFFFSSAAAYFTPNQAEASVFFTYRNSERKVVKLKTIRSSIKPDLSTGSWLKFNDDFYTCNESYMQCRIKM